MTVTTPDNADSRDLESDGESPKPFQLESYAHLLKPAPFPATSQRAVRDTANAGPIIDAIVVPTIRSAEQLRPAVQLAAQMRCQLIALYTSGFPDGLSAVLATLQPGQATALALVPEARHLLLDLAAGVSQSPVSPCALDISKKRNLGLLIGRACGWTRMLFLDDDIRRLSAAKLSSAAALLNQYPVVGLQVTGFPDASVVGHARRLAESVRKPFISGGAMLVNPQRTRGFFPPVYHEDWLCVMDHLRLGEVVMTGKVRQLAYQPFTTTARAQLEEFGDILAPALLWLLHANRNSSTDEHSYWHEATNQQFWRDILNQRTKLLDDLSESLELLPLDSIQAARKRCEELSPKEFVSFMTKWRGSLATWRILLSSLPGADSVAKAVAELGLLHVVTMLDEPRSRVRAAAHMIRSTMDVAELPKHVHRMGLRVPGLRRHVRAKPDR